jgi:hypothetical protein
MVPVTILEAAWLLSAVTLPLLFNTLSYRVFEPEKVAVLRLLAVVAAAGLGASLLTPVSRGSLSWARLRHPAGLAVIALVAAASLSSALSLDPWQSVLGTYHRQGGLVTLLACALLFASVSVGLRTARQLDRLLSGIVLAGVSAAGYAVVQRVGLDPIAWDAAGWGGDPLARTPGSFGNPTFLAGFLAASVFVTVARLRGSATGVLCLALQAAGLWAAASRGAMVAVAAGAVMMAAAYAAATRTRWLSVAAAGTTCIAATVLILLNLPISGLEGVRDAGPWRRVAHVFDSADETTRVRVLLWQAAFKLMTRDAPIEMVGGVPDRRHAVRALTGYGPETLSAALSREYPAELARLERPDAVLDRAHNDVVDAWTTGGALAVLATMAVYVALLLAGCRALGLGRGAELACVGAAAGGALIGAAAALLAGYAWLAVPVLGAGAIAGVTAMLLVVGAMRGTRVSPSPHVLTAAGLMAAVAAHAIDAQLGIATVAPRAAFWLVAGCLVALASWSPHDAHDESSDSNAVAFRWLPWMPVVTLAFGFAPAMVTTEAAWPGLAVLAALAVVVIVAAWRLQLIRVADAWRGAAATIAAVAAFVGLVWWGAVGNPETRDVVARVSALAWPMAAYGALLVAAVAAQARAWRRDQRTATVVALGAAALVLWPALAPVRADVLVRAGRQLELRGYAAAAIPLHEAASRLVPHEIQYRVAAAGSAQLAAATQADPRVRDALFERAASWLAADAGREADLQRTFATARLYYARAAGRRDPGERAQLGAQANAYYQRLTTLSPGNPLYWNDWASLALDVFRNASVARARLQKSLALDPQRPDTQRLLGEVARRAASGS